MELKKIDWHDYKAIAEDTQRQGMGSFKCLGIHVFPLALNAFITWFASENDIMSCIKID